MALASLAVDYARVQVVKTQLRRAVDAAARYGATGLASGNAVAWAQAAAADNTVNGVAFSLQAGDIQTGSYSGGTFTAGGTPANAVQINAVLSSARGNAVPLIFGQAIGMRNCNVTAKCLATCTSNPVGIIGLNSITSGNSLFIASYDSSLNTTPTTSSYNSNGVMQTNGAVAAGSGTLYGNLTLGPGGSVSGLTVNGSTLRPGTAISAPTVTMQVVTNPGGISQTPVIGNGATVNWPGGTYYFTSLTMGDNGAINFTGAATVYLDGNASTGNYDNITAYSRLPSNLVIYQSSGHTFVMHDSDNVVAAYWGPGSDITISHDHCNWYGSVYARTITTHDNDSFFLDQRISGALGTGVSLKQ